MSTRIKIENIDGPDYIIIYDGNRQIALAPGQSKEVTVCFDVHFNITEADKIYQPED